MKKTLLLIVIFISVNQLKSQVLNVGEVIQEQNQWCWAAVSACILDYYCATTSQCEIAEYTRNVATWHNFGSTDCCVNASQGCNYWNYNWGRSGSIQDILQNFAGITNYGVGSALSKPQIASDIQNNRLFVIRWGWASGGGHFVVGHGLIEDIMYYMDPWYGEGLKIADYNWVVSGSNHTWTHTNRLSVSPISNPPASAGTITGLTTVCQGQNAITYNVSTIANATSYLWTQPTGATGTSTTNSITVNFGTSATSGNITVKGTNSCGEGEPSTLAITVNAKPSTPEISLTGNILHSDAIFGNQWYDQNGSISGAINQDYTATVNGDYYVIVTLLGCSSDASNILNVVLTEIALPEYLSLEDITIGEGSSDCFAALLTITTAGDGATFVVENGGQAKLVAGQNIIIREGTRVEHGGLLHARITTDGTFCPETDKHFLAASQLGESNTILAIANNDELSMLHDGFFRVYPNPTAGRFTLELDEFSDHDNVYVEVYSILGTRVISQEMPVEQQHILSLEGQQPGIYIIRVLLGDKVGIDRLIKK